MRLFRNVWVLLVLLLMGLPSLLSAAERMAVKADTANVRSGPGVKYDLLWQIEKYHPILILDKKEGWYRFKDFEGDQGWIQASLVDATPTVIVRAPRCNVRSGPGTEYDIVFISDKCIPYKILQTKGQWVEIQHADGDKGWISSHLLW